MLSRPVARRSVQLFSLACLLLVSGCASSYLAPFEVQEARPGVGSPVQLDFQDLPAPADPVVVAVYRFRDQTGQYKASEGGSTFSTAVTQGGTSILMRALETSGWFIPIEREGLSNLLNERQIIQSTRAQYQTDDGQQLAPIPPLLYAGILLEGGIVGYDTNILTGGAGVRYFGAGGSGQFRQDQVTVYLRAVSTQTGRVLKTVYTTKTIISQKVDGGLFRFVDAERVLEAEAGYSYNEPPVTAVTEAIEDAVRSLIIEGVAADLWSPANPNDRNAPALAAYYQERDEAAQYDVFNRKLDRDQKRRWALTATGTLSRHEGDFAERDTNPGGGLGLRMGLTPRASLGLQAQYIELSAPQVFNRTFVAPEMHLRYDLLPYGPVTPFLQGGVGAFLQLSQDAFDRRAFAERTAFPYVALQGGVEVRVQRSLGLQVAFGNQYPLLDGLDGTHTGTVHDNLWGVTTGLTWYLR